MAGGAINQLLRRTLQSQSTASPFLTLRHTLQVQPNRRCIHSTCEYFPCNPKGFSRPQSRSYYKSHISLDRRLEYVSLTLGLVGLGVAYYYAEKSESEVFHSYDFMLYAIHQEVEETNTMFPKV